ncbi:MAG: hypothetical protein WBV31_07550 [Terriglobales bacterium]|jgi:hypothetical protein
MVARIFSQSIPRMCPSALIFILSLPLWASSAVWGQESPYIVTYDHYLEEPGSLEVEYFSTFGTQRRGNDFDAFWMEFEYGVTAWWTTELYLAGQTTFNDSTILTGTRFENRLRLLQREHIVNPVLYLEFENTNGADKILKEVEGHDVESDYTNRNGILRQEHDHELEMKLLLSSTFNGWNVALNPIVTRNLLPSEPWELAYALGASRPLALKASPNRCNFCPENFIAGAEIYGGLGDARSAGLHHTSHYLAPVLAWNLPSDWTVRFSGGFGLNENSHRLLLRWGLSREFSGFGELLEHFLGGRR